MHVFLAKRFKRSQLSIKSVIVLGSRRGSSEYGIALL
jgi:hypothetical protein